MGDLWLRTNYSTITFRLESELSMRVSQVVSKSDCQCQSCNSPRFTSNILRHSGTGMCGRWSSVELNYFKNNHQLRLGVRRADHGLWGDLAQPRPHCWRSVRSSGTLHRILRVERTNDLLESLRSEPWTKEIQNRGSFVQGRGLIYPERRHGSTRVVTWSVRRHVNTWWLLFEYKYYTV